MVRFNALIKRFGAQGEKTGWTYIEIPEKVTSQLKPGFKKAFRVKGSLDAQSVKQVSLIPMGEGNYILPLNASMRKQLGKMKGDILEVQLEEDTRPLKINTYFLECLKDEPSAWEFFHTLPQGHRNYFSKWIESAKTDPTRDKRIAQAVNAL
ncbi:MAG: DUF1905 domain-containing protein, partial [Bacteroidota bacterium]|nr:DUF1905 domain-containing protein [Bacteroidota bacterium]